MDQAIILAAGEGQRLRPLTVNRPKVMLGIGNKPILRYVLEAVAANGIRRVVLVVGYHKEHVQDYFGSGQSMGMEISYVEQKQQLGTAHALKQAEKLAADSFLVLSGDNIIRPGTIAPLLTADSHAVLVKQGSDVSKYGVVTARRGHVTALVEKPAEAASNLVNTGIYAFKKEIFSFIEEEVDLPAVLTRMVDNGIPVRACETSDAWLDVVYPWDMLKLNALVLEQLSPRTAGQMEQGSVVKGPVVIGEGAIIRSGCYLVGPAIIGRNCEIGPHACVFPSTSLGNNVILSPFCSVRNSVVGSSVQLGPSSHLEDSIIGAGTRVGGHFVAYSEDTVSYVEGEAYRGALGAVIGENSKVGPGVSVGPGTVVGNRCQVLANKALHTNIPDGALVV